MEQSQIALGLLGEEFAWSDSLVANVARRESFDTYIGRSGRGMDASIWENGNVISGNSLRGRLTAIIDNFGNLLSSNALVGRLDELHAMVLGCWCAPSICHGHVLTIASHEGVEAAGSFVESLKIRRDGLSKRVLVTGSRDWVDVALIKSAFNELWREWGREPITLVVGDASGADSIAADIWAKSGWEVEIYKADWSGHGKSAGPKRNAAMIASGVDGCLAFANGVSAGTQGCIAAAKKSGIDVREFRI